MYIGATLKGRNMLPMWSIFFPLIVAPFKMGFSQHNTDTNILWMSVHLLLIV